MPLNYPATGNKQFEKVSPGLHVAVCYMIVDVGLQPGSLKFPDPKRQVRLQFEVPGETVTYEKDGQEVTGPMTIGAFYTASMHENANLRKQLESWRNKRFSDSEAEAFDIGSILGKPCQIQVMHSDDGKYANIMSILPAPKGCKEKATNKLVFFANDGTNEGADDLPKWLSEKVINQLDPAVAKPLPPVNGSGKAKRPASEDDIADREAAIQAQRRADRGSPSLDPDDDIPFAPRGKRSHWE